MGRRGRRRERVEPTEDWEHLALPCRWPEQLAYEEIRPLVLFGAAVGERAEEVAASERTLYRRMGRFEAKGMDSLFATQRAKRLTLPPATRRLVVDLKAEHPALGANEIAKICYVRFGRRPDYRTLRRWRLYGEEGLALAGKGAALWLQENTLTLEHGGEPLSRLEVELAAGTGELGRGVGSPTLFETSHAPPQLRLFARGALGEAGWLKAVRLEDYARRKPRGPQELQRAHFAYHGARG